jgi:hypothetical protein
MAKTVVGLFDNFSEAEHIVRHLEENGFSRDQISVVANQSSTTNDSTIVTEHHTGDAAASGAGAGAVTGGAIGGGLGLLASLGLLAIPGIGPILAAGPIIATLSGAGIGAATGAVAGGLIGALTEAGVPEEEAGYYDEGVRRGGTLVTVSTDDTRAEEVAQLMRRHGAVDIEKRGMEYRNSGWTPGTRMDRAASSETISRDDMSSRVPPRDMDDGEALLSEQEESDPTTTNRPGKANFY